MSYSLAFAANWYGHLCMMGLYPIAMVCGMKVELPVFYRASGLIHTFIFAAVGLYLIRRKETKREKEIFRCGAALYCTRNTDVWRHDGRDISMILPDFQLIVSESHR